MPKIGNTTYPDTIDEIIGDHKLMRLFNQFTGSLRKSKLHLRLMFQFVQTPPQPTGMWQFLNSLPRGLLMIKLTQQDRKKIDKLKSQIATAKLDSEKEEWALKNWKGWADIRSNTLAAWKTEINKTLVPAFYEDEVFKQHHHTANASGSPEGVQHAIGAIKMIKVDDKMAKALGYTNPKDKKLQLALGAVAKSAALNLDKPGKEAFAEVVKIEKLGKYAKYEDLAKAMKQKKVFV